MRLVIAMPNSGFELTEITPLQRFEDLRTKKEQNLFELKRL
jgi:hypothetical protein